MSALRAAQERLWFLHQLDPADASYHLPLVLHVRGRLDRPALQRALDAVTARHGTLRARVDLVDGTPVLAAAPGGVRLETAAAAGLEDARDLVAAFVARPFDLAAGPMARWLLIDAGPDGHVLALVAHHVAADGWSLQVLRRDLDTLYRAHTTGTPAALPELPDPPPDEGGDPPDLGYWTGQLAGAPVLELATDHPRPPVRRGRGSSVVFDLPVDLLRRLETVARAERTTVYTALVAAFSLLLGRISGQHDICLGTPVLGRDDPDLAGHVGCYAETLVLRTDLSGDPTFRALLRATRRTVLGALSHAAPFERVVSALGAPRDRSRTPLFSAMIMYLRQEQDRPRLGDLDAELLDHPFDAARTDVSLDVVQGPGTAVGVLTVDRDLFDPGTAQRLIRRLLVLLDDAGRRPDTAIGDLRWFDDDERREALHRWNDTGPGQTGPLVAELFQARARSAPDAVAVTGDGVELTYRDLDAAADRLAARLRGRGPLIGVGLSRSPAMVVALLAVWRAGAAYLPLDPAYPADRLAFVIADAGVTTVLTEAAFAERFGAASLLIDAAGTEPGDTTAPVTAAGPDDPAYVLYTSGSTGRPKGVVVPHGALAAFVAALADITGPQDGRAWLALTSLSFDISGLEVFLPLSRGGRVVVAGDAQTADGAALRALIAAHGVTDVQATPSGWRMLLAAGFDHDVPAALVGGEALPATLATELRGRVGRLTNVYGPTETTIWSTYWPVPGEPAAVSIGGPIPGTRVYVVDDRMRPVPAGVPGELVIAGAGVALGYLRRPRLTADRFGPDPWGPAGARMYRTGDRVRRRADGGLEFLGRLDTQVKLRGHRIELGEVETVLAGCPGVAAAVAAVRDDSLAAYVTARPGAAVDPTAIRDATRAGLPAYAVPATVTVLDALPLTPNGKVDRSALPDPRPHTTTAYVPPRTAAEARVAAVFGEVFAAPAVGAHDDFFALGGHSLLAVKVAARLPGLTVRDLFDHPTVEALARRVPAGSDAAAGAAPDGPAPLTDAQRRLWFLQRLDPDDASYNMFLVLRLRGPSTAARCGGPWTPSRPGTSRCGAPTRRSPATQASTSDRRRCRSRRSTWRPRRRPGPPSRSGRTRRSTCAPARRCGPRCCGSAPTTTSSAWSCTTSPGTAGRSTCCGRTSPRCTPDGRWRRCHPCRRRPVTSKPASPTGGTGSPTRPRSTCRPTGRAGTGPAGTAAGSSAPTCPPTSPAGSRTWPPAPGPACSPCCSPPTRCCSPGTPASATSSSARPWRPGTGSSSNGPSATSPGPSCCATTSTRPNRSPACSAGPAKASWTRSPTPRRRSNTSPRRRNRCSRPCASCTPRTTAPRSRSSPACARRSSSPATARPSST
ncbi:hypothetical protein GCM10027610_090370 [Dactylosporangium cerinum]